MKLEEIPTLIYANKKNNYWKRKHFGPSQVACGCSRLAFLEFRKGKDENNVDKTVDEEQTFRRRIRIGERGDLEEVRIAKELRKIEGIEVLYSKKARDYGHFEEGHFQGTLDILTRGWEDQDKNIKKEDWINTECKTFKNTRFNEWVKKGLFLSDQAYFAQAQVYMNKKNIKYTVIIGVNKDTEQIHVEIIAYNPMFANQYIDNADKIIFGKCPAINFTNPNAISNNGMGCKICKYRTICWEQQPLDKNCRTCEFIKPMQDGTWFCTKLNKTIKNQKKPCECYQQMKLE